MCPPDSRGTTHRTLLFRGVRPGCPVDEYTLVAIPSSLIPVIQQYLRQLDRLFA